MHVKNKTQYSKLIIKCVRYVLNNDVNNKEIPIGFFYKLLKI